MNAMFNVQGISKNYGGVRALCDIDLTVERGEIRGMIGPNGAGKSTFIDIVSGRTHGDGAVFLDGEDLSGKTIQERRLRGMSRSFQRTSIFPEMNIGKQLGLATHVFGDSNLIEVTESLGLANVLDRKASEVGYGEQRRLDLALTLIGSPKILLLDEPAAGLSHEDSMVLADHVMIIAKHMNVPVIIVEHDMDIVFRICDSVTVLETGKKLAEGTPDEVRQNPGVKSAYLGSMA